MGQPAPGERNEGFRLVLFLALLCLQGTQVKAMETRSCHPEKEMEKEADRSARRRTGTDAVMRREDPVHWQQQQQQPQ